ncbi:putative E3 ubiquitin-protein ligase RF298 [Lycium ferocissimum]|uniref:putative E3 ubiquitin-protein ligase RF298 n=1 Tax=Lycium ferocissimum TaxID=112874 RepID=UPI0028151A02|nr:putative E3 ubiquitin-protein ligase RF298 [Lycium ferocissimum]XP_059299039.1 putative E3 ubiquitin-protein ligase RF298 [Lycium ferocissimum]XP_059299040.1 putative E3 ubiquitin-protein ligase RF298 [Lycium ferocissimum]
MASMVAKAFTSTSTQYSPAITVPEKGSRNKRKFMADPPLSDPDKLIPSPQIECTSFEFSADKFGILPSRGLMNGCDICSTKQDASEGLKLDLGLSCSTVGPNRGGEEVKITEDFHDADWSDLIESQLEELVLSNLDTIFKSAIKKIAACGYSEETAEKAVLRSGVFYGLKDIMSNIVDNTLAFLCSRQESDASMEHHFEDLQLMEKYVLAELVCILREVRPFFSIGDAMWCLLICDMNVSHACAMDSTPLGSLVVDGNENSSASLQPHIPSEAEISESNSATFCKPTPTVASVHSSERPNVSSDTCGRSFQPDASKPKSSVVLTGLIPEKESPYPLFETFGKTLTATGQSRPSTSVEKFVASRKVSGITKREYILRQKSLQLEKFNRTSGSKGASRKLRSFGGLVLDKKLKSLADSASMKMKNSMKVNKIGATIPQDNVLSNFNGVASTSVFGSENGNSSVELPNSDIPSPLLPVNTSPEFAATNTELSLSLPAKYSSTPMPISYDTEASTSASNIISNEKCNAQWICQVKKDEMILKLVPRVTELQSQLQEWTEWANQKVMQAARRLSKDKSELKTLLLEKEEVERLKKEKKTLEESTLKKQAEMENALRKASGQIERASAAVRRLECENAGLRREMEAAKLHAVESSASCQEVLKREKKTLMKFQSWEKQKAIFQDELVAEKRKLIELYQQMEQAKVVQNQLEARWKQEKKAKEDFLTLASSLRKEREQIDASAKSKEDTTKFKAGLRKYKDDIEKLEKEISQLRLKADSSKIAALKRGIDGSYASRLTDLRNVSLPKDNTRMPYIATLVAGFEDHSKSGGLKRERECVMCLSEERSIVFLPCAHQVVCTTCNQLHQKQGMKDCPSCRSPIQRRLSVRYSSL